MERWQLWDTPLIWEWVMPFCPGIISYFYQRPRFYILHLSPVQWHHTILEWYNIEGWKWKDKDIIIIYYQSPKFSCSSNPGEIWSEIIVNCFVFLCFNIASCLITTRNVLFCLLAIFQVWSNKKSYWTVYHANFHTNYQVKDKNTFQLCFS